MKYDLPDDQGEVLPNLPGLTDQRAVELADMMAQKQGYGKLHWERIGRVRFDDYVQAAQQAAVSNRQPMEAIIRSVFPD